MSSSVSTAATATTAVTANPITRAPKTPLDVLLQTKIIPFVGDPTKICVVCKAWNQLHDGSYRVILDAYRDQRVLSRFVVNVPREGLSTAQYKQQVRRIYQAVMQDHRFHRDYRRNFANPLALAANMEYCERNIAALQARDAQLTAIAAQPCTMTAIRAAQGLGAAVTQAQRNCAVACRGFASLLALPGLERTHRGIGAARIIDNYFP